MRVRGGGGELALTSQPHALGKSWWASSLCTRKQICSVAGIASLLRVDCELPDQGDHATHGSSRSSTSCSVPQTVQEDATVARGGAHTKTFSSQRWAHTDLRGGGIVGKGVLSTDNEHTSLSKLGTKHAGGGIVSEQEILASLSLLLRCAIDRRIPRSCLALLLYRPQQLFRLLPVSVLSWPTSAPATCLDQKYQRFCYLCVSRVEGQGSRIEGRDVGVLLLVRFTVT